MTYSYNQLGSTYFITSVMLASLRCTRDDNVSAQVSHHSKRAAMR
jgi:hypothetical protein